MTISPDLYSTPERNLPKGAKIKNNDDNDSLHTILKFHIQ